MLIELIIGIELTIIDRMFPAHLGPGIIDGTDIFLGIEECASVVDHQIPFFFPKIDRYIAMSQEP